MCFFLIYLGFWQLDRAEEKRFLEAQYNNKEVSVFSPDTDYENSQRLVLKGHYLNEFNFLLDNQVVNGRVGYDVITPFWVEQWSMVFMVNRGWVLAEAVRSELPLVADALAKEVQVRVHKANKAPFLLSSKQFSNTGWPKVVQYFSAEFIESQLTEVMGVVVDDNMVLEVYPLIGRLEMGDVLVPHWSMPTYGIEKHIAYAFQWFLMAFVLFFLIVYLVFKSKQEICDVS